VRRRARGQRGAEQEGGKERVLPFYRGICACAEHVRILAVPAMRAARLDKSVLARPSTTLRKRFSAGRCGCFFPEASKRWQWQCQDKTSL